MMLKLLILISTLVAMSSQTAKIEKKINRETISKVAKYDYLKKLRASSRARARSGITAPPSAYEACVDQCADAVTVPPELAPFFLEVVFSVIDEDDSTDIRAFFDEPMIGKYCGLVNGFVSCARRCPAEPNTEDEIVKFLSASLYICNETNFAQFSKCYKQVYDADVGQCNSAQKCGPYKFSSFVKQREMPSDTDRQNQTDYIYHLSDNLCQYVKCGLDCRKPELVSKCSQEQYVVLANFYQKLLTSIGNLAREFFKLATDNENELRYSDKCKSIAQTA